MLLFRFRALRTLVVVMCFDVFQFRVFLPVSGALVGSRLPVLGLIHYRCFFNYMEVMLESIFIRETCAIVEKETSLEVELVHNKGVVFKNC